MAGLNSEKSGERLTIKSFVCQCKPVFYNFTTQSASNLNFVNVCKNLYTKYKYKQMLVKQE